MEFYRLKHVPTGLYYQPGTSYSNLSKRGKVYTSGNNALNYYSYDDYLRCYVIKNSEAGKIMLKLGYEFPSSYATTFKFPKSEFIKEYISEQYTGKIYEI